MMLLTLPAAARKGIEEYRVTKQESLSVPSDMALMNYAFEKASITTRWYAVNSSQDYLAKEWGYFKEAYPIVCDWLLQDLPGEGDDTQKGIRLLQEGLTVEQWKQMITKVCKELGKEPEFTEASWLEQYVAVCRLRRQHRLKPLFEKAPKIVFTKHCNMGAHMISDWAFYAVTEALSETTACLYDWQPGSALCILTADADGNINIKTLLEDPYGIIRDPDVSYDGKRILFAWKKSLRADDYHLYEMDVQTRSIRQLTSERGQADYEAVYLPDGGIVFNSTRCVQTVDCFSMPVSNLYRCDGDGKNIRRLTYDQVHNNFPRVLNDGRILYTRWEYNDRGQKWPQPLFAMRPDGSGQAALYGGNSFFPTSLLHARPIPGSTQVVAIASGHHTAQLGKLVLVDFDHGQDNPQDLQTYSGDYNFGGITTGQRAAGIKYLAPEKDAEVILQDFYGQVGELFCHPYPIDRNTFVVSYCRDATMDKKNPNLPWRHPMGLYLIKADGRRELLARDRSNSCNQPVALAARQKPPILASMLNPKSNVGQYFLQDIYQGLGLKGIERGSVKKLRVVELIYRAAGIGVGTNMGIAGASAMCTPVSVPVAAGTWDVKKVLGEVEVGSDGSVVFEVPAETPVYFQAIDANGYVIQTMRSWSTLHRGEKQSCIGCHETNKEVPANTMAGYGAGSSAVKSLKQFYDIDKGFSFIKEIQPILDRHCISCHWDTSKIPENIRTGEPVMPDAKKGPEKAFSLLGILRRVDPGTKRLWSDGYLALTGGRVSPVFENGVPSYKGESHWGPDIALIEFSNRGGTELVNWINAQSEPTMLEPYTAGAAKSKLMTLLRESHKGVKLSQEELDKIACWIDLCVPFCGDYMEANDWTPEEVKTYEYYQQRRKELAEKGSDFMVKND